MTQEYILETFTHGKTKLEIVQDERTDNPYATQDQATGIADWARRYSAVPTRKNKDTKEWIPFKGCFRSKEEVVQWAGQNIHANKQFLTVAYNFYDQGNTIKLGDTITITPEQYEAYNNNDEDFDIDEIFGNNEGCIFICEDDYNTNYNRNKIPTQEDLRSILEEEFTDLAVYVAGDVYGFRVSTTCECCGQWVEGEACWGYYKMGTTKAMLKVMAGDMHQTEDIQTILSTQGVI
jgi:hypothetical protein